MECDMFSTFLWKKNQLHLLQSECLLMRRVGIPKPLDEQTDTPIVRKVQSISDKPQCCLLSTSYHVSYLASIFSCCCFVLVAMLSMQQPRYVIGLESKAGEDRRNFVHCCLICSCWGFQTVPEKWQMHAPQIRTPLMRFTFVSWSMSA